MVEISPEVSRRMEVIAGRHRERGRPGHPPTPGELLQAALEELELEARQREELERERVRFAAERKRLASLPPPPPPPRYCRRGHLLDDHNGYRRSDGVRVNCRQCERDRWQRRRSARRS